MIFSIYLFASFLSLVRHGLTDIIYDNKFSSIVHTLVGRINMQLYLTKFYKHSFYNIEYSNSFYPFIAYFIPRTLLKNISIYDKPIPFGLAYARHVTDRPYIYMTVAGSGITKWIHSL